MRLHERVGPAPPPCQRSPRRRGSPGSRSIGTSPTTPRSSVACSGHWRAAAPAPGPDPWTRSVTLSSDSDSTGRDVRVVTARRADDDQDPIAISTRCRPSSASSSPPRNSPGSRSSRRGSEPGAGRLDGSTQRSTRSAHPDLAVAVHRRRAGRRRGGRTAWSPQSLRPCDARALTTPNANVVAALSACVGHQVRAVDTLPAVRVPTYLRWISENSCRPEEFRRVAHTDQHPQTCLARRHLHRDGRAVGGSRHSCRRRGAPCGSSRDGRWTSQPATAGAHRPLCRRRALRVRLRPLALR